VEKAGLRIVEFELNEATLQASFLLAQNSVSSEEISLFRLNRKAESRLQNVVLIGYVMSEVTEGLLDSATVQRVKATEFQPDSASGLF
jgi:uncharacterized membrane protein